MQKFFVIGRNKIKNLNQILKPMFVDNYTINTTLFTSFVAVKRVFSVICR